MSLIYTFIPNKQKVNFSFNVPGVSTCCLSLNDAKQDI